MSLKKEIIKVIKNYYKEEDTMFLRDLYQLFLNIKKVTLREMLCRLVEDGQLNKVKNGVYQFSKAAMSFQSDQIDFERTLNMLYLFDRTKSRIGYQSGVS